MGEKLRRKNFMGETAAPLIVVLVFTFSAAIMIMIAAIAYKETVSAYDYEYYTRTSLAYVIKKIHRGDEGSVEIGQIGGCSAVIIKNEISGREYCTYLYQYDGYLREIFAPLGTTLSESSGAKVMELADMSVEYVTDNLLKISCTSAKGANTWGLVGVNGNTGGGGDD